MDLFVIENNKAFPSVHALMLEPFKGIWEADTSTSKGRATKVLTCIEFMCSPKKTNPFSMYFENDRIVHVKKEVYGSTEYQIPDEDKMQIVTGCEAYKRLLSISSASYSLFDASLEAASRLEGFLRTLDFKTRTQNGSMLHKPGDVTKVLKEIPEVVKGLLVMKDKVHSELTESESKTRNQRDIGDYER